MQELVQDVLQPSAHPFIQLTSHTPVQPLHPIHPLHSSLHVLLQELAHPDPQPLVEHEFPHPPHPPQLLPQCPLQLPPQPLEHSSPHCPLHPPPQLPPQTTSQVLHPDEDALLHPPPVLRVQLFPKHADEGPLPWPSQLTQVTVPAPEHPV